MESQSNMTILEIKGLIAVALFFIAYSVVVGICVKRVTKQNAIRKLPEEMLKDLTNKWMKQLLIASSITVAIFICASNTDAQIKIATGEFVFYKHVLGSFLAILWYGYPVFIMCIMELRRSKKLSKST